MLFAQALICAHDPGGNAVTGFYFPDFDRLTFDGKRVVASEFDVTTFVARILGDRGAAMSAAPTLADALDFGRFDAIGELSEFAALYWRSVGEAELRFPTQAAWFTRAQDDGSAEACWIACAGLLREARR